MEHATVFALRGPQNCYEEPLWLLSLLKQELQMLLVCLYLQYNHRQDPWGLSWSRLGMLYKPPSLVPLNQSTQWAWARTLQGQGILFCTGLLQVKLANVVTVFSLNKRSTCPHIQTGAPKHDCDDTPGVGPGITKGEGGPLLRLVLVLVVPPGRRFKGRWGTPWKFSVKKDQIMVLSLKENVWKTPKWHNFTSNNTSSL